MAALGFRTMDEMIGRVDRLNFRQAVDHWKAKGLDFSAILYQPEVQPDAPRRKIVEQDHGLDDALDNELIAQCARRARARDAGLADAPDPQRQPDGRARCSATR